jgi:hypothetical protein
VIPGPEWIVGRNETLCAALNRRITTYNAYVAAYNDAALRCSIHFEVKRPPMLAIASSTLEPPYEFLGMAPKYCVSYPMIDTD